MQRFWSFSKRYVLRFGWWYFFGFVLVFLTQFLAVGIVDQTRQAIDSAIEPGATPETVIPFVITIAVFAVLIVIVRTGSRLLIFTPARLAEFHIRNDYYSNLLFLQRDFLGKHESGDLVSRCSNDITFVRAAFGFGLLQLGSVTITLFLGMGAMLRLDLRTTLYLAIPMLVGLIIVQGSIRYFMTYWRRSNQELGSLSGLCLASYRGVAAIQNYHAEPDLNQKFAGLNQQYLKTQMIITKNRAFIIPLVQLVGNFSVFIVLWIVGPGVINNNLTVGEVAAFLGYIAMMMPPLLMLGWMLNVFNRAVPAMERLDEIILAKPNLLEPKPAKKKPPKQGAHLQLRDFSFRYPPSPGDSQPFKLSKINLDLPPGKVLGIVGPLGSGKSTLLDALLRLNQIEPGHLFLNDQDGAYMDLNAYRGHFSFAPQRAFLFSSTLKKNLLTAVPAERWQEFDDSVLMERLVAAGFHLDPEQFPKGLETEVGEKGIMLSGGQRQRIALARALLKQADIFVLDDVLSAVDHDTEKTIIANLKAGAAGKSFVITSHRLSAVQWADEILVMKEGGIEARGSHQHLVNQPGYYSEIYAYQSQETDDAHG